VRVFVLVASCLAFFACRPQPVKPAEMRPLPAPADALNELRQKSGDRKNLRALARVTYFGPKGRARVKAALLAERPSSFRVETISPFEQPLDVMASDGTKLWLLSEQRLREGPATPENISRLLPLAMNPEEVVDTLLGGVPTSSRFTPKTLEWAEDGEHWVLTLDDGMEESLLIIDPVKKVVEKMTLGAPGRKPRLSVEFEDFERIGNSAAELPHKIHIELPDRGLDVRIKLDDAEVDVPLAADLFRIAAPPGIEPEPLVQAP
jgi:outer membrane lipoprotein-sorting protein